ncbi:MAG: desulfoferrodoxin [Thermoplasmata archaeon]|nr:MAG: desulfoferrodoxin [Thermoplasmata archaeon]
MTELLEVYKCEVCGNIVEVVHNGAGELVCCGKPMVLQQEKSEDQGQEKHLPVVEKTDSGVMVKVGSVAHPMEAEHYIEWIEVVTESGAFRKFLKPGDTPEAQFDCVDPITIVRSYCNIHGLWSTKM